MKPVNTTIDEAMLPLGELFEQCCDQPDHLINDICEMKLTSIEMGFPMQLDLLVDDDGRVSLGGSPPLVYVETSFDPVFHQIKIKVEPQATTSIINTNKVNRDESGDQ